jgi:hypothetical protein
MPVIADYYLDLTLAGIAAGSLRLDLCTQEPTTFAEATATYTKANKTGISVGAPADRAPNGRKVTVAAISAGTVTGTGTVTHWAITDTTNSRLVAANALSASQALTSGNTFSLAAFDIGLPDAVSA